MIPRRLPRFWRLLPLVAALLVPGALRAELPAAIATFAAEQAAVCAGQGGQARIGPAFATEIDLNGDGRRDFVLDLAGVECANAWSAFCGPDGCPVSVWITGAGGPVRDWSGLALGWRVEGPDAAVVLSVDQTGSACPEGTDPGAICRQALTFEVPVDPEPTPDATTAAFEAAAAAVGPPLPLGRVDGDSWNRRSAPGGVSLAVGNAPAPLSTVAVVCRDGEAWLALAFATPPEAAPLPVGFAFSEASVKLEAKPEADLGGAFGARLAGTNLSDLLSGRDASARISLDGTEAGNLSLRGSTRAIRAALTACPAA